MHINLPLFSAIGIICAMSFTAASSPPKYLLCPSTLVEAKVADVGGTRLRQDATLLVTQVFYGDGSATGKTFKIWGPRSGDSNNGSPSMLPPYRVGELQIWMVTRSQTDEGRWVADISAPHLMGRWLGYLSLPARKGVKNSRYPEVRAWAEAVEKAAGSVVWRGVHADPRVLCHL